MNDANRPHHEEPALPMPLPTDTKTVFLGGIFIILLLGALKIANVIAMPIVLAFIMKLVLQPVLRLFERMHIPRSLAALFIIVSVMGILIGLGTALSGPAASWMAKLPASMPRLERQFGMVSDSFDEAKHLISKAEDLTNGTGTEVVAVAVQGNRFSDRVFSGTQSFISGLFTTMLVLFFLLSSGDTFLRRIVEILPRFQDKRHAVDLSQKIEHNISIYLLTVTIMNALVGIATALIMNFCGVGDAILWGTLAFMLNYIPILGPMISTGIFLFAGIITAKTLIAGVMPALLYMLVHALESSIITPMLIAKRFTLNPVLVTLSLIFWYWMWGIPGAILAMPMLTIIKITCDRIPKLAAFGHFMGG